MLDQMEPSASSLPKALWMRIRDVDSANDGGTQVVQVMARRCVIGTDDTCNLRVGGPTSRPVHCLLVRGARHIVIRRWSPDTLLNGQEFSEAVLSVGDRVTAGASEFEILDADAAATLDAVEQALELVDEPGASLRQNALGEWQTVGRLREAVDLNRARARRLLRQVRAWQKERDRELATGDAQRPEAESEKLAAEACRVDDKQPAATIDQEHAERAPAQELTELRFEEVSTRAPVAADELLNRMGFELPADEQVANERVADERAASSSRWQPEESSANTQSDDGALQPESEVSQSAETGGDEDESIDACIARFMERLASTPARAEASYVPSTGAAAAPASTPFNCQAESPGKEVAAGQEKAALLTELPQRSGPAASRPANLSAMRELAQQQARSALDVHFRRTFLRSSVGQVLVVIGSLAGGVFCLLLSSHAPLAFFPAMIGFAVAIVWSAQYAQALVQLAGAPADQAG